MTLEFYEGYHGNKETSGFEDDIPDEYTPAYCRSLDHDPPMHIVIPPGKIYRHVCSGCGRIVRLRQNYVFL